MAIDRRKECVEENDFRGARRARVLAAFVSAKARVDDQSRWRRQFSIEREWMCELCATGGVRLEKAPMSRARSRAGRRARRRRHRGSFFSCLPPLSRRHSHIHTHIRDLADDTDNDRSTPHLQTQARNRDADDRTSTPPLSHARADRLRNNPTQHGRHGRGHPAGRGHARGAAQAPARRRRERRRRGGRRRSRSRRSRSDNPFLLRPLARRPALAQQAPPRPDLHARGGRARGLRPERRGPRPAGLR